MFTCNGIQVQVLNLQGLKVEDLKSSVKDLTLGQSESRIQGDIIHYAGRRQLGMSNFVQDMNTRIQAPTSPSPGRSSCRMLDDFTLKASFLARIFVVISIFISGLSA